MRWMTSLWVVAAWIVLVACNDAPVTSASSFAAAVRGPTPGALIRSNEPDAGLLASIGTLEAQIDITRRPALRVTRETTGGLAGAVPIQRNGPYQTWAGIDGATLTTLRGVVTASRGIAPDLLRADVADVVAALDSEGGRAVRTHIYLDGLDQEVVRRFDCSVEKVGPVDVELEGILYPTTHLTESCHNAEMRFTNEYWRDTDGVILSSRQWLGPANGTFRIERIID